MILRKMFTLLEKCNIIIVYKYVKGKYFMEENTNKKRPNVVSTINDNGTIYYFCDDGNVYKLDLNEKLVKISKEEQEEIIKKYKENNLKEIDISIEER